MEFDVEGWYKKVNQGDVVLSHAGSISTKAITMILDDIEQALFERSEKSKLKKKIYNVVVEALQNLYHHTDNASKKVIDVFGEKFATFVLKKESENTYVFYSGNFIYEKNIKLLRDRINQINYLTVEELKILYKLILNNNEFSDKGGGGLGLVDIAKRTGCKFEYSFNSYTENCYFFCLKVTISV
ncbi:MAG: hypothetical protein B6I20_07270 [Bacteroidetes bacterium 4572_117]|nr:MAG: hypothetical protein B6I20_07270 [Bacteroidetes bacterium 4572_117]